MSNDKLKGENNLIQQLCKDPFRLYFPMAFLVALYAGSSWIGYAFFQKGNYPGLEHARLFVGGYLYFAIFGFLMTAIPRFTQSHFLKPIELLFSGILIASVLLSSLFGAEDFFWSTLLIGWVLLIQFAARRFLIRKQNPPYTFLFVGIGILLGFAGSAFLTLNSWDILTNPKYAAAGKVLFYDGMVLSLILGVGGRLIPGILGFKEIVSSQRSIYEKPLPFLKVIPFEIFLLAFAFLASLALEVFHYNTIGWILRAVVISYMAIKYWSIHKKPSEKKYHGLFLRISCFFIAVGSWLIVIFPSHSLGMKHLIYIGGYALMTFLIASRVILAHGNSGLSLELKKMPYVFIGSFFALAALARASVTFVPSSYMSHLGYAGGSFTLATIVWGVFFIPKTLQFKSKNSNL